MVKHIIPTSLVVQNNILCVNDRHDVTEILLKVTLNTIHIYVNVVQFSDKRTESLYNKTNAEKCRHFSFLNSGGDNDTKVQKNKKYHTLGNSFKIKEKNRIKRQNRYP